MEELNLIELIKYYLRKLPIVILIAIVFGLIGYYQVKHVKTPLYKGTTTIILVEESDNKSGSITQSDINLSESLVSTYSKIIKSRRVLNKVIESLELEVGVNLLASNITVTPVSNTPIIQISVSNKSNTMAVAIANKIAEVFKSEITKIYNLENVSVIDEAIIEENPYNINLIKEVIIYVIIGIVLSSGIIILMFYFNTTIKNGNEIKDKLNLVVLGEVPTAKLKKARKEK